MVKTTTAVAAPSPDDEKRAVELENAALRAAGFDRVDPATRTIAAEVAKKYGLELMLRHLLPIEGRPYVTRDGLLHVAHKSGQLDGVVVEEEGESGPGAWWARVSVYRKDMKHPFTFRGRYSGTNKKYGPEMAVKCAEVMGLRRAFDVALPTVEEQGLDPAEIQVRASEEGDREIPLVNAEIIPPDDSPVASAKKREPRVAPALKDTPKKEVDWKESLPPSLGDGMFLRSGDVKEDAKHILPDTLKAMAGNFLNHWTSPEGDAGEAKRVRAQLAEYGYFTDPAVEAKLRKCVDRFMSDEDLDKAIRTVLTPGKPTPLDIAIKDPGALDPVINENSKRGEIARYAVKVAASLKAKPAASSAAAKAAAAKAKAAPKKSPEDERREKRIGIISSAHKEAGKEEDLTAELLEQYLEASEELSDAEFEDFAASLVTD